MATTLPAQPTYKVPEIAKYLGVDRNTVYDLVKTGDLHAIRVGRFVQIPAAALADFVSGGGTVSANAA